MGESFSSNFSKIQNEVLRSWFECFCGQGSERSNPIILEVRA